MAKHTQEYINGVLGLMWKHTFAAGIEWEKVRRNAIRIAERSNNAYDADREFCDFLYLKQLEDTGLAAALQKNKRR